MSRITKIFLFFAVAAALVGFAAWHYYFSGPELKEPVSDFLIEVGNLTKEVIAPPPLKSDKNIAGALLTVGGVVEWTNAMRTREDVGVLSANKALNTAAELKLQDMLGKQYFDHVSPSGADVSSWVGMAGYEYIVIGENLALGNFSGDKDLVEAWMNSPGHRANILSEKYSQIGVAVGSGVFEGRSTWLAVQIFGLPIFACPQPSGELKSRVELYEYNLNNTEQQIIFLKNQIQSLKPKGRAAAENYNTLVAEYNKLIYQYNSSVEEIKSMVEIYNSQVKTFNSCAEG